MRIDNTHDVVSGADSDTKAIYIDRRIPRLSPRLKDKRGGRANLWKYLTMHETTEAKLMAGGMGYDPAHRRATMRERALVESDGISWEAYEHEINGYLAHIEREKVEKPPPSDQHVAPHRTLRRRGKR